MCPVVCLRGLVSVSFVYPDTVIKYPDIFKYGCFCFFPRMEMASIKPFLLELALEALHRCIVPAVAFPAHAADKAVFLCQRLILDGTILAASVRMQDTSLCIICMVYGIQQRIHAQFLRHTAVHGYPHDLLPA